MLRERNPNNKVTYYVIPRTWHAGKGRTMGIANGAGGARGSGWREGLTSKWSQEELS